MDSSERVPSDEWAALEHMWEDVAEAWFRPEGGRSTFLFRVPRDRFDAADAGRRLTVETLLEAASIPRDEVESWHLGDGSRSGAGVTDPELSHPLPPPPPGATHLTVHVRLKLPAPTAARGESGGEIPPEKWHAVEALWKAILGLEAAIDSARLSMDGVRAEMEAACRRAMTVEEKVHGLQADVAQWEKAKNRVHYALPKVREFVHRATWAPAVPERKRLEEVYRTHIEPRVPPPDIDRVREQLEHLQKDRQVLFAQGNAVAQECRAITAEIARAVGTLQRNAADNARRKRSAAREKGKYF